MGPELVKNAASLEHLLGLSGDDRASVGKNSKAGGKAEAGRGRLIDGDSEGGYAGDRLDQFLSSANSTGTSLDTLTR